MSVYAEIIEWSKSRPAFIQDAIRRLFLKQKLSDDDYAKIKQILIDSVNGKTQCFKSASANDIPQNNGNKIVCTRLLSIENPNNISSLYEEAKIDFSETGLSIVFGENGTGKSSYSRILKKFCWSRQKTTDLKPNIYSDKTEQSVKIRYKYDDTEKEFVWKKNETDPNLNSIFVYDGESALKYITEETEIDFKPVGIEILEKISALCQRLDEDFSKEIQDLSCAKPFDGSIDVTTDIGKWYSTDEIYTEKAIREKINFSDGDSKRKNELAGLLNIDLLKTTNKTLEQKRIRYVNLLNELNKYELIYSDNYIQGLNQVRNDYLAKKSAYELVQQQIEGSDPLPGVGSATWKELWESAKKYALMEVHPDDTTFPKRNGEKICVFCQQPLSIEAEKRLERFNSFISDDTSAKLTAATQLLTSEKNNAARPFVYAQETLNELKTDNPDLMQNVVSFIEAFKKYKEEVVAYLEDISVPNKSLKNFSILRTTALNDFKNYINSISSVITKNTQAIEQQSSLQAEYNNCCEKEKLFSNIDAIVSYYYAQEKIKSLRAYKNMASSPKAAITKEIAFLLENESLVAFNTAFDNFIRIFSPDISNKIEIKKGRAAVGKVYQRSYLKNHNKERLTEILSEGEQKVVVLANFLAECSLDNDDCTIVFDDPVTSLDYKYRDKIASILVDLSKKRQVIVLTHDFYFTRLLIDTYKKSLRKEDYKLISLNLDGNITGIPSDELPYLMKNINERISSIHSGQKTIRQIAITDIERKNYILETQRKRMRALIEKTIEEVFAGKSIQRFSKNIQCKEKMLSSFVCVEKNDIEFILSLFSRYSETEHDGTPNTNLANADDIDKDLQEYLKWHKDFSRRLNDYWNGNNIKG